jgi:hypothetical protein
MTRSSIILGVVSLASAVGFFALTTFMGRLPYGENDFDLILLAIALADIALFSWAVVISLMGLAFGVIGLFQADSRWISAIGMIANLSALVVVGFTFWR